MKSENHVFIRLNFEFVVKNNEEEEKKLNMNIESTCWVKNIERKRKKRE